MISVHIREGAEDGRLLYARGMLHVPREGERIDFDEGSTFVVRSVIWHMRAQVWATVIVISAFKRKKGDG